jgi:Lhr-like helicase
VVSTTITVIAGYESINTGASPARTEAQAALSALRRVVVDKWHELPGNKRGMQL